VAVVGRGGRDIAESHAGFGPIGPWIVTPDELADPDDIAFSSTLDGAPLQSGRTSDLTDAAKYVGMLSAFSGA